MSAFWEPDLTTPFQCASPKFANEPECVKEYMTRSDETVNTFLNRRQSMRSDQPIMAALQSYLLGPLRNTSLVGKYSKCWENSIYMNGYSHDETVRLAYMYVYFYGKVHLSNQEVVVMTPYLGFVRYSTARRLVFPCDLTNASLT